jgi:hypothetical protein
MLDRRTNETTRAVSAQFAPNLADEPHDEVNVGEPLKAKFAEFLFYEVGCITYDAG